jgi:hypothetical protein
MVKSKKYLGPSLRNFSILLSPLSLSLSPPPSPLSLSLSNFQTVFSYRGADKSLVRPGRKQAIATEDFDIHTLFIFIIGGILVLFIHITRLASNERFSPSNKSGSRSG